MPERSFLRHCSHPCQAVSTDSDTFDLHDVWMLTDLRAWTCANYHTPASDPSETTAQNNDAQGTYTALPVLTTSCNSLGCEGLLMLVCASEWSKY